MAENKIKVEVTVNGEDYSGGTGGTCECEGHKVIDNLNSNDAEACLSANQGRVLNDKIDNQNKALNERIDNINVSSGESDVKAVEVVNNLNSTSTVAALSANQGRVLKSEIDNQGKTINTIIGKFDELEMPEGVATEVIDNLTSSSTTAALSANQGRLLNNKINNINISGGTTGGVSKVTTYETVADMKSATDVKEGMLVITMGYYGVNDGGAASYYVRSKTSNDSADDVFIHISGDLVFEMLIEDNTVNLAQLGFFATRASDGKAVAVEVRTEILRQAILKFKSGGKILLPAGNFGLDPININVHISKLTIMGVSSNSTALNFRNNSANSGKYLLNFNKGIREMRFEGFQIDGANNGSGIYIEAYNQDNYAEKRNVFVDFKDVYMWEMHRGIYVENGVYFVFDDVKVHLTSGCVPGEDFGICMVGYEYNYFRDCSFQTNSSNNYKEVDLLIIKGAEHVWIDACEFAKTNGSCIKLSTKGVNQRVGLIFITDSKFQKVSTGVCFELGDSKDIGDIRIDNCDHIASGYKNAQGIYPPAIYAYKVNSDAVRDIYKLHIRNFYFGSEGSYTTGDIIRFEEYPGNARPILMREIGLENVMNAIGSSANNGKIYISEGAKIMYLRLSDCVKRTATLRSNGNQKIFTVATGDNLAISGAKISPSMTVGFDDPTLEGYYYTQSACVKTDKNGYSMQLKFEEPLPAGEYTAYLSIRY